MKVDRMHTSRQIDLHTAPPRTAARPPMLPTQWCVRRCGMKRARGFTLVEILIVVVILGILASIVVPRFTNASEDARASALRAQLQTIRGQIEIYRARHGVPPNLGTNNVAADWDPLINPTAELSYLQGEPINPFNGLVGISATETATAGWVWDAANGRITAPFFNELTGIYAPPGG